MLLAPVQAAAEYQHLARSLQRTHSNDSAFFYILSSDDLAIATLQMVLNLLRDWLNKWRLIVNLGKMVTLLSGLERSMTPQFKLRRQEVEFFKDSFCGFSKFRLGGGFPVRHGREHGAL
ncbi:hypothetical protein EVAR_90122_1 [Eumeta japonica]|uniref:Uncharacterized protein n=1 Tax=Eumeta variegata TaxID=151549 RepID=A0A4C1ZYM4_EUMVA|nr:hypothetical protein EVAR_90122_1 [Eumeta japonica]